MQKAFALVACGYFCLIVFLALLRMRQQQKENQFAPKTQDAFLNGYPARSINWLQLTKSERFKEWDPTIKSLILTHFIQNLPLELMAIGVLLLIHLITNGASFNNPEQFLANIVGGFCLATFIRVMIISYPGNKIQEANVFFKKIKAEVYFFIFILIFIYSAGPFIVQELEKAELFQPYTKYSDFLFFAVVFSFAYWINVRTKKYYQKYTYLTQEQYLEIQSLLQQTKEHNRAKENN